MRIGIDLGGTKIEIIALQDDGTVALRQRVDTPQGDMQAIMQCIGQLVIGAEAELGCQATVGIGMPGSVSRATGLVKNSNSVCLNGQPFTRLLEEQMQRPLRFANDADCMTLSEAMDGAGEGASSVFGVILGTGVGGGLVANGQLLSGPNSICGEWGHNPLPWPHSSELPGPDCYCGKQGCVETWLSGPGLSGDYLRETGESLSGELIVERAVANEERAIRTLRRYIDRLARSLAAVINIVDPEVIVLAGGLSNVENLYRQVPQRLADYVFSDRVDTRIVQARHGDSSGVRGAAWLWPVGK